MLPAAQPSTLANKTAPEASERRHKHSPQPRSNAAAGSEWGAGLASFDGPIGSIERNRVSKSSFRYWPRL